MGGGAWGKKFSYCFIIFWFAVIWLNLATAFEAYSCSPWRSLIMTLCPWYIPLYAPPLYVLGVCIWRGDPLVPDAPVRMFLKADFASSSDWRVLLLLDSCSPRFNITCACFNLNSSLWHCCISWSFSKAITVLSSFSLVTLSFNWRYCFSN